MNANDLVLRSVIDLPNISSVFLLRDNIKIEKTIIMNLSYLFAVLYSTVQIIKFVIFYACKLPIHNKKRKTALNMTCCSNFTLLAFHFKINLTLFFCSVYCDRCFVWCFVLNIYDCILMRMIWAVWARGRFYRGGFCQDALSLNLIPRIAIKW